LRVITHVFFDAGNTLVYPNLQLVAEVVTRHGAPVEGAALEAAEPSARVELDRPAVIGRTTDHSRWTLYFQRMLDACGVRDPRVLGSAMEELQARHRKDNLWERVPPEVPAALRRLHGRFRLSVISNANGTVREKLQRVGLASYFDQILDSHEEGIEKPDPRLFHAALERTGARAESSVYVGDMYHIDVVGARAAGLRAVLIDPVDAHADKDVPRIRDLEGLVAWIDGLSEGAL
jgi:putative hydrolase of the HAD superfamily